MSLPEDRPAIIEKFEQYLADIKEGKIEITDDKLTKEFAYHMNKDWVESSQENDALKDKIKVELIDRCPNIMTYTNIPDIMAAINA